MNWWELVGLVASLIAAIGVVWEIWYRFWTKAPGGLEVDFHETFYTNATTHLTVIFTAMGAATYYDPEISVTGAAIEDSRSTPPVLDVRSKSAFVVLRGQGESQDVSATVEISWVDSGNRSTRREKKRVLLPERVLEDWKPYRVPFIHKTEGRWVRRKHEDG